MEPFLSELQHLSDLYSRLDAGLPVSGARGQATIEDSILPNRDLFTEIEHMNSRLLRLGEQWLDLRRNIDSQTRDHIRSLAQKLKNRAAQLAAVCEEHGNTLRAKRQGFERDLEEIKRGTRYLESVRPLKSNHPKFVDSLG